MRRLTGGNLAIMKVDNAIILAAGVSSRFAPLSYERHKALIEVKGEILIERQIRQLKEAGVPEIYIITGYKAEQFEYLKEAFGVKLLHNPYYLERNNNSSIWVARDVLANSYICSADNYFSENLFEADVDDSYYSAVYSEGYTDEWCMTEDRNGYISGVNIGGEGAWYMLGHTFWSADFTQKFLDILMKEYDLPETASKLWENILIEHLDVLKMKIRRYTANLIYEFDTLNELREFDNSYINDTRSGIIKKIAKIIRTDESDIKNLNIVKGEGLIPAGFEFDCISGHFKYYYKSGELSKA